MGDSWASKHQPLSKSGYLGAVAPLTLWGLFINTNSYFTAQLFSMLMAPRAPCKQQGSIPLGELLHGAPGACFQSLAETTLDLKVKLGLR